MTTSSPDSVILTEHPPITVPGILRRLGPGLIIAGSIVGSGELIGTTTTGALAGYWLLWLILVGCVIKVFVQVEFGRYAISTGQASMVGMNETPGPVLNLGVARANWLAWYWLAMFLVSLGQLGGIVGGVGQALAISVPLTEAGRAYNREAETLAKARYNQHMLQFKLERLTATATGNASGTGNASDSAANDLVAGEAKASDATSDATSDAATSDATASNGAASDEAAALRAQLQTLDASIAASTAKLKGTKDQPGLEKTANDHLVWATLITAVTSVLLVAGRYGLIQWASTLMVAVFTLVTVLNVFMLQAQPEWAVTWSDIWLGLSCRLPPKTEMPDGSTFFPLTTALATFGIIGVGANELIAYPYWCVEKGYARFVGQKDESTAWVDRARGWLRVMRWDAWCSMGVYTFATVAFYLLGAATLGRIHLVPKGNDMIRTLSIMYEPVFGEWTGPVFLFGAFAVLYSTFFVAIAGHARVSADAWRVFRRQSLVGDVNPTLVKIFSGFYPVVCLVMYLAYPEPTTLVLASGAMQAMMLPMLSFAAIYFRYRRTDSRIKPSLLWDICLWISAFGMLIAGGWLFLTTVFPSLKEWA
jgi:Mn2+/Fe2+ NRAMP family transporter